MSNNKYSIKSTKTQKQFGTQASAPFIGGETSYEVTSKPTYGFSPYWSEIYHVQIGQTWWELIKIAWIGLFVGVFMNFLSLMLRGMQPNPIVFGVGIAFTRAAFTVLSYTELKGLTDPFLVLVGMFAMRIHWKSGLVAFSALLVGGIGGAGMVYAMNPQWSTIVNDGAPTIQGIYVNYVGIALTWEFLATFIVYMTNVFAYGYHKMYCYYKKRYNGKLIEVTVGSGTFAEKITNKDFMNAYLKAIAYSGSHSKAGFGIIIGFVYGAVSLVGFYITGSGLDFFQFLWSATFCTLLNNTGINTGYANWWIYFVGPIIAVVAVMVAWWPTVRILRYGFEEWENRKINRLAKSTVGISS